MCWVNVSEVRTTDCPLGFAGGPADLSLVEENPGSVVEVAVVEVADN